MLLARSAPEGEADEIAMNPDIDTRRSAVGGKADVPATWPGSPLLAKPGHFRPNGYIQLFDPNLSPMDFAQIPC